MTLKTSNSIIIIGAGLAGLTAADQILKSNPRINVTILESMKEPGGRTCSIQLQGAMFDMGGQWIGPPQKYVNELAKRANCELIEQYHDGIKFLAIGTQIQQYKENLPEDIGHVQLTHLEQMMKKIDEMAKTVPLQNPRMCPNSIQWDSMTAHTWIEKNIQGDKVRKIFEFAIRTIIGCETNQVSFLFFLWYVNQNHGFNALMYIQDGLQKHKFAKGSQSMSFFLENEIKKRGGKIYYGAFVDCVVQNESGVTVKTRKGQKFSADYLIISAPPPAIKKINFEPKLSRQRRMIIDRYIMGSYSKMIVLYKKPYWREKGFSGQILSDCLDNPIIFAYDDTRPKENGENQPALVIFFTAAIDEQWTGDGQFCKKSVISKLASYFKCQEMLHPIAVEMKIWNNQDSLGGAPTAFTPPGVLTKINNIRDPQGLIHWAGSETALVSVGYMDGAIESGIRVSKEILQRFQNKQPVNKVEKKIKPNSEWYSQILSYKKVSGQVDSQKGDSFTSAQ